MLVVASPHAVCHLGPAEISTKHRKPYESVSFPSSPVVPHGDLVYTLSMTTAQVNVQAVLLGSAGVAAGRGALGLGRNPTHLEDLPIGHRRFIVMTI